MTLFAKKKPPEPAAADEQKISLALTPDEIDLLRECMKRTEDYYRGLLLLKQDWNAAQNEAAIAMIKVRLNMIDKLQEKGVISGEGRMDSFIEPRNDEFVTVGPEEGQSEE